MLLLTACSTSAGGDVRAGSPGSGNTLVADTGGTPPADGLRAQHETASGNGTGFSEGGEGGESLLGGPGTPYDEQAEWTIVPFTDPRTGQTYDIVDGRVTVAFKNPPQLPMLDPNYFDTERMANDIAYSIPTPDPLSDPAIAAFVAAENLDVVSSWNWVKSIGAILPPGQTVLDAVQNWPAEYPSIILSVDPDNTVQPAVDEPQVPPDDDLWAVGDQWAVDWPDFNETPPGSGNYINAYPIDIVYAWGTGDQDNQEYRYYNDQPVEIAIIDTGVDYDSGSELNADLVANSDTYGCNVGESKMLATTFLPRTDEGGEPWDWLMRKNQFCATANGHGTCVAGIISAKTNNDHSPDLETKDVAGIAYNPMYFPISVKLFAKATKPLGAFCSWGIMNAYTALGCVKGALDESKEYYPGFFAPYRNIEVVNCSYGGPVISNSELAMVNLLSRYILFVCGTGNDGSASLNTFPARIGSTFSVAAYNQQGQRVSSSNYAPDTDIAAPGEDIWTCDMVGYTSNNLMRGYSEEATASFHQTSAATPHIAAIAILVTCKYEPNLDPGGVKGRILAHQKTWPELSGFGSLTAHPDAFNALYGQ